MNDMSKVIIPKSDQISADDLIAGPMTITIAAVDIRPGTEQPVSIHFEGDDGRPWKPCKSMSRVLVAAWGPDAKAYIGRSATLYRDPTVRWGGVEVGGIRVSHLTHMERDMVLSLTMTKQKKAPFVVKVLRPAEPKPAAEDKAKAGADAMIERIRATPDLAALEAITRDDTFNGKRQWLRDKRPELATLVDDAVSDALARVGDGFPADTAPAGEG